jgi:GT2 family glycosyltransferase
VGGPGVTPPEDGFWRRLSGCIFSCFVVSGRYTYRYLPKTYQEVEDFPTCNLSVRRKDFEAVGGFDTRYWPGEDTILCLKIVKELRKKIVYDPDAVVYHHRRSLFGGHLRQVKEYALHRGFFARRFPETSRRLSYFVPSLFVIGLVLGLFFSLANRPVFPIYSGILALYSVMIVSPFLLSFRPKWIFFGTLGVFLTHVTYGLYFIRGLLARNLER